MTSIAQAPVIPAPSVLHPQVLGLSGKAGAGKNYLAREILVPRGYFPVSLADPFKVTAVLQGAPMTECFFGEKSPETRALLQRLGTEEGRLVHGEDYWTQVASVWLAAHVAKGWPRFVVTDIRFPNEVDWIHSMGGQVWQITGRGGLSGSTSQHPSETALDGYTGFDHVIVNEPGRNQDVLYAHVTHLVNLYEAAWRRG